MDLSYSFSRHKIPRTFSYPMKRTALDAAISARNIRSIESVVYYFVLAPRSIFRVAYNGEQNKEILKPGAFSIWIYAVPSTEKLRIQEMILRSVVPVALDWIEELDHAGNVRRTGNHHFVARYNGDQLLIEQD
jgi:hypothetical protein